MTEEPHACDAGRSAKRGPLGRYGADEEKVFASAIKMLFSPSSRRGTMRAIPGDRTMPLCHYCQQPASLQITEIVNGIPNTYHFCEKHAMAGLMHSSNPVVED